MPREFDIVLFGASGSVGTILAAKFAASQAVNWAIAGRSTAKLEAVYRSLPAGGKKPRLILANAVDEESMREMARRAMVLVTTVGPYAEHGEAVVRACVEESTHYVDITGEAFWVSEMRAKYQERAVAKGVCVVSFAGYDCVPFELCVYLANQALSMHVGSASPASRLVSAEALTTMTGGAPRGTLLTCLSFPSQGLSLYANWLSYVPTSERLPFLRDMLLWALPWWSAQARAFTLPEFMGAVSNTIVHASAPALGYPGLRYNSRFDLTGSMQAMMPATLSALLSSLCVLGLLPALAVYLVGLPLMAVSAAIGLPLLVIPPTRNAILHVVQSYVKYDGDANATLIVRTRAKGSNGELAFARLTMKGDPGIYVTATCLAETALAMLECQNRAGSGVEGASGLPAGFMTPMAACGEVLAQRITKSHGTKVSAMCATSRAAR